MITEDFVSYEVAKLLKEKGFVIPCDWLYCSDGTFGHRNSLWDKEMFPAPTLQMAMKWLREIYGIDIVIEISNPSVKDRKYYCMIWDGNNNSYILDLFNSYEEATESAIEYCLENLI